MGRKSGKNAAKNAGKNAAKNKRSGGSPSAATPALSACVAAGIDHRVFEFAHSDDHFGAEAALWLGEHHGVPAERIFKTLVVVMQGKRTGFAVAVAPVTGRVDLKAAARALGASKVALADPDDARRATGYVVGGISPLGQKRTLPTVVDSSAREHATVFVSGGRRGLDVELSPDDLASLTGATFASLAA
ncbi:Cys-tRNA(Pro) deacylase [uncultured Corynebacterium sp.]|uniref:Cys-tRNA(Pro) deacylase n=1 Tax=uncultured Corynebacterium sp. TaxID=159447 RepID=UPI0025E8A810|nr:Cys-tRNA(Pro) deacylase [uncultured Corynebacterium sp.]